MKRPYVFSKGSETTTPPRQSPLAGQFAEMPERLAKALADIEIGNELPSPPLSPKYSSEIPEIYDPEFYRHLDGHVDPKIPAPLQAPPRLEGSTLLDLAGTTSSLGLSSYSTRVSPGDVSTSSLDDLQAPPSVPLVTPAQSCDNLKIPDVMKPHRVDSDDCLGEPNHAIINHIIMTPIKNGMIGLACTQRYREKYSKLIFWKFFAETLKLTRQLLESYTHRANFQRIRDKSHEHQFF